MKHIQDAIAAIDRQIAELERARDLLQGTAGIPTAHYAATPSYQRPPAAPGRKRAGTRQMSDEARQRIANSTKARWERVRAQKEQEAAAAAQQSAGYVPTPPPEGPPPAEEEEPAPASPAKKRGRPPVQ